MTANSTRVLRERLLEIREDGLAGRDAEDPFERGINRGQQLTAEHLLRFMAQLDQRDQIEERLQRYATMPGPGRDGYRASSETFPREVPRGGSGTAVLPRDQAEIQSALDFGRTIDREKLRQIVKELEATMQCNCDLDNWEPEVDTGHSWVCRIHKAAKSRQGCQPEDKS